MNIFDEYTHSVLFTLLKNKVKFIIVGGYAVNYYGYRRTTGDIDLWIKPDNGENKSNIVNSFKELGVDKSTLKILAELDFEIPQVFIDGEEPFKIDFLTKITGVNFEEAWKLKTDAIFDNLTIPFLHYNHLILSKISSGRPKDKLDVEELQRINVIKSKSK